MFFRRKSPIIAFYSRSKPDVKGRVIGEIWSWDFETLERTHDYIQWLFPLQESSGFNANAPILDENDIAVFNKSKKLKRHLAKSLVVMLRFYGFDCTTNAKGNVEIVRSADFLQRKLNWISLRNHNYLRITRIMKCLRTLGLEPHARAFFAALDEVYRQEQDEIGSVTYDFWRDAVGL